MRIAYFVWEYPPLLVGGLGTYAAEMVPKLEAAGNEIDVFTLNDGTLRTNERVSDIGIHRPLILEGTNFLKLVLNEDLKAWGEHLTFFNKIFAYNYLSATKLVNEMLKKRVYDLVVINDWLSAPAGIMIKQTTDIPVVFHVHSTEQQRVGNGSQTIKNIERDMAEKSDMIITVSYSMKDHLISLGYPEKKINVVWNGCNPDYYSTDNVNWGLVKALKERYFIEEDEKVVLFVGRLTEVKGVRNLVLGFPEVLKEHPKAKLVILGKGEQYEELVGLVKKMRIEDRVKIRSEFVPEDERIAHYAMADLCVFPSTSEPFGIVSLEAMCLARPLVVGASGISGFREQVVNYGDEQTGIHIDGRNPSDIAWGINEILKDNRKAALMGEFGRKRAEDIFNIDKVSSDTLYLYRKAVESKSRVSAEF
ncbi:MAG: glycosyltransferase family 4 protein [Candidatus Aenigmarchaeota archaeon]|nr:glycosyltransferase family 4 protein [Candidatus Aenigmarchaeota archaeon]